MTDASLAAANAIEARLGPKGLRRGEAVAALDPGWHTDNFAAGLVALPASTEEVAEIVRICDREGVAIVQRLKSFCGAKPLQKLRWTERVGSRGFRFRLWNFQLGSRP